MTPVQILKNHEIKRHASIILNLISKNTHYEAVWITEYKIDEENNSILFNIEITPLQSSGFITYTRNQILKAKKNTNNIKNKLLLSNLRDALVRHTLSIIYSIASGYDFYVESYQRQNCRDFDCLLSFTVKYFTSEEAKTLLEEADALLEKSEPIEPSDVDYARA